MNSYRRFAVCAVLMLGALYGFGTSCSGEEMAPALPAVDAMPPPHLPSWIREISPVGQAANGVQIRVLFQNALVPDITDEPNAAATLVAFHIFPNVAGHFRFITPREVEFESLAPLSTAMRLRITIDAGLHDESGNALNAPIVWTFDTSPLVLSDRGLINANLEPSVYVGANANLDTSTLLYRLAFESDDDTVPAHVQHIQGTCCEAFVDVARALRPDTRYRLVVSPGARAFGTNVAAGREVVTTFQSLAPLRLERIDRVDLPTETDAKGRFVDGAPVLVFNNELDAKTIAGSVTITRAQDAKSAGKIAAGQSDIDAANIVRIDPKLLEPNTSYVASVDSGLTDKFGSHAAPQKKAFITGPLVGTVDLPEGFILLPFGASPVTARVADIAEPSLSYSSREISEGDVATLGLPEQMLPAPSEWNRIALPGGKTDILPIERDNGSEARVTAFALAARAYPYADEYGIPRTKLVEIQGLAVRTGLGIDVQTVGHDIAVKVTNLADGSPVGGADVSLIPLPNRDHVDEISCALGQTDFAGLWVSSGAIDRCSHQWWGGQLPPFTAVVRSGKDWTILPVGERRFRSLSIPSSLYGTLLFDRGVYRPGDLVHVAGIMESIRSGVPMPVRGTIALAIDSGPTLKTVRADTFGRIHATIRLPTGASAQGDHVLVASSTTDNGYVQTSLQIAEPRVPAFTNTLEDAHPTVHRAGNAIILRSRVETMTGARLAGARVAFNVEVSDVAVEPSAFRDFAFPGSGPEWRARQKPNSVVSQTANDGNASFTINIPRDLEFPLTYSITSDAVAQNDEGAGARLDVPAKPIHTFIGIALRTKINVGDSAHVRVVASDVDGHARPGRPIEVRLERGDERHPETIATRSIVSGGAPSEVTFRVSEAGDYRIEAAFLKPQPGDVPTSVAISAAPSIPAAATPSVSVVLDRPDYEPGDVAKAMVAATFENADVLLEVVSKGLLWKTDRTVAGRGTIEIPIDERMVPNAIIRVLAVKRGTTAPNADYAATVLRAETPLSVRYDRHVLDVRVTAKRNSTKAGDRAAVRIDVRDVFHRPVRAAIVVAIVDDALLSLDGYRFASVANAVFSERPIEATDTDNRLHPAIPARSIGPFDVYTTIGAVRSRYAVVPQTASQTRQSRFALPAKAFAYFDASQVTNAEGVATIDAALPSNATRWRVLIAAVGPSARFGNGETTFIGSHTATMAKRIRILRAGDLVTGAVKLPAAASLDAPSASESPPPVMPRLVDAGSLDESYSLEVPALSGGASVTFRGAPWKSLEAVKDAASFRIPDAKTFDSGRIAVMRYADRQVAQNGYAEPLILGTSNYYIRKATANNVAPNANVLELLRSEVRDPGSARVCGRNDDRCARRARLYALDALAWAGLPLSDHVAELFDHRSEFTLFERLMLAVVLAREPAFRDRADRAAAELRAQSYVGATKTLYAIEPQGQSMRSIDQCEAVRLGIARSETAVELAPLLYGLPAFNFIYGDYACQWTIQEYANRYPVDERSVNVTSTRSAPAPTRGGPTLSLSAAQPIATIGLASSPVGELVDLHAHGGVVSFAMTRPDMPETPSNAGDDHGITVEREVQRVNATEDVIQDDIATIGLDAPAPVRLVESTIVAVRVRIVIHHPTHDVNVFDFVPAGLEPIDRALKINSGIHVTVSSDRPFETHMLASRIEAHASECETGTYTVAYLARVVAPGSFIWPAARVEAHDDSGDYGTTATAVADVRESSSRAPTK